MHNPEITPEQMERMEEFWDSQTSEARQILLLRANYRVTSSYTRIAVKFVALPPLMQKALARKIGGSFKCT